MIYSNDGEVAFDGNAIDILADISLLTEQFLEQTPVKLREFTVEALKKSIDLSYDLLIKRTDENKAEGEPAMEVLLEKVLNGGYADEEDKEDECE